MNKREIGKRLIQMVVVLFGVSFITFLLTYLAPSDPATAMYEAIGVVPTEEMIANARRAMGLDKPFLMQYWIWLSNCLSGNFGMSFSKNQAVLNVLVSRLWPTIRLALLSIVLMLAVSLPAGIYSAVHQNRLSDYIVRGFSFVGTSMPEFWAALLLMYIFAMKLNLLPVVSSGAGWQKMILPSITLAITMASKYTRQVRTAVLEELNQDYVTGARARGLTERQVLWKHVLPNAMLPLITMLGISLGYLLGGTAVVEIIFSYPGIGNLVMTAADARDYPLIQGLVLWIATIYMILNLIVDLSYYVIDPRIRKRG